MKIVAFRCELIYEEAVSQLATSYGPGQAVRPHVILELRSDDGLAGYGEASPLPHFTGETAESVKLMLERHFLPDLIGADPFDLAAVHSRMASLPRNTTAKSRVDVALHYWIGPSELTAVSHQA